MKIAEIRLRPARLQVLGVANVLLLSLAKRLWYVFAGDLALSIGFAMAMPQSGGIALSLLDFSYIPGAYLLCLWRAFQCRRLFTSGFEFTLTPQAIVWNAGQSFVSWTEFQKASPAFGSFILYFQRGGFLLLPARAIRPEDRERVIEILTVKALLRSR